MKQSWKKEFIECNAMWVRATFIMSPLLITILVLATVCSTFIGCSSILPTPKPKPIHVRIPANTSYMPVIAWEVGLATDTSVLPNPSPTPSPRPNPSPTPVPDGKIKIGDDCPPPCDKGWTFGDGSHKQVCWKCKGDGIAHEGDPILNPLYQTPSNYIHPLSDDEASVEPELAPPEEPYTLTKPIEILVAKDKQVYVYSIIVNGETFEMQPGSNVFIGTSGYRWYYEADLPIAMVKSVTINGIQYPVKRKSYMVDKTDAQPRSNGEPPYRDCGIEGGCQMCR